MKNVICDICATAYPSDAKKCPICGSSREYALENVTDNMPEDTAALLAAEEVVAAPRKKNKEIFDFDEVNQVNVQDEDLDEVDLDEEEEEEEISRTNVGLVVVLIILIVLLLLASCFFFLKYLLPNMSGTTEQTVPVTTVAVQETEPAETTDPTIPCTNLMMDGGKMELGKDGKKLLNVRIYPENTTDALVYTSGDEAVVTVSEDGTVTAVGEGVTMVTVQCGTQKISCTVTVDFGEEEATVPEGTIPGMTVETTADSTQQTQAAEATEATQAAAETVPAETEAETTEAAPVENAFKLKKEDITISSNRTSVKLELEGDIDPAKVKWFTMDSTVAICLDGVVTSTGSGMTRVYGEYNGQQVMCIVRCVF